jgi:hypothetical protein
MAVVVFPKLGRTEVGCPVRAINLRSTSKGGLTSDTKVGLGYRAESFELVSHEVGTLS